MPDYKKGQFPTADNTKCEDDKKTKAKEAKFEDAKGGELGK